MPLLIKKNIKSLLLYAIKNLLVKINNSIAKILKMKKFKLDWGVGIVIVIVLFLGTVIFRVIYSSMIASDIVATDYYHKELDYSQQIEKKNNTYNLTQQIKFDKTNDKITITFPEITKNKKVEGKILFYCPAKVAKDLEFDINLDANLQQIYDKKIFSEPRYIIQIDWKLENTKYYQELDIQI